MTLRVFALQFLDGHHYAENDNAADKNIHRKALGAIGILLLERTDLVKQFFTRSSLEAPDIDKVIFLVYTERRDDGKQNPGTSGTASANRVQEQRLSCAIRAEDMPLLADCLVLDDDCVTFHGFSFQSCGKVLHVLIELLFGYL